MQMSVKLSPKLLGGILAAVVIFLILIWIFPIEDESLQTGTLSGVEQADRYSESTINEGNVNLEDPDQYEFIQSAAFQNMAKDPELLKACLSTDFQAIFWYSQILGFAAAADYLQSTEEYQTALNGMTETGITARSFDATDSETFLDIYAIINLINAMPANARNGLKNAALESIGAFSQALENAAANNTEFAAFKSGELSAATLQSIQHLIMSNAMEDFNLVHAAAFPSQMAKAMETGNLNYVNRAVTLLRSSLNAMKNSASYGNLLSNAQLKSCMASDFGVRTTEAALKSIAQMQANGTAIENGEFNAQAFMKFFGTELSAYGLNVIVPTSKDFAITPSNSNVFKRVALSRAEDLQVWSSVLENSNFQSFAGMRSFQSFLSMPASMQNTVMENAGFSAVMTIF